MTLATLLGTCLLWLLQSAPDSSAKEGIPPDDRKKLVTALQDLRKAAEKERGEKEAREKLGKAFEEVGKRLKIDPLAFWGDLQKILEAVPVYGSLSNLVRGTEIWCPSATDKKFRFALRIPKAYDPKKAWPVLLVIPPAGEEAVKHLASAWKEEALQASTILAAAEMPAKTAEWAKADGGGKAAWGTLRELFTQFNVDRDRVVIGGAKEGGSFVAAFASHSPDRFAGVLSRGGGADGIAFENLGNLPSYFTGSAGDLEKIRKAAKDAGRENVTTTEADDLAAAAKWITERVRDPFPKEVTFSPVRENTRSAYWLKIEKWNLPPNFAAAQLDKRPMVKGSIDRGTNTVTLTAREVTDFTVFLSDALLDLDKPVRVLVNGKPWEGAYKRELGKFLEFAEMRNDPKSVYVGYHVCAIP